jgi:hypothetical protein
MAWWSAATLVSSQRHAVLCQPHFPWLYQARRRPCTLAGATGCTCQTTATPVLAGCGLHRSRKVLRAGSRLALVASVVILGFINLSHPWQNVDALSLKSMLARLRHHVARVSPLPPRVSLRQTRPSFMLLRTSRSLAAHSTQESYTHLQHCH